VQVTVVPQVVTADVAVTTWIDAREFDSAMFLAISGAVVASGLVLPVAREADDASGTNAADVAAADLEGAFTNMTASAVQKVGYRGTKGFLGVRFDHVAGTSIAAAGVIELGHPHQSPVAQV
jgi:hypothetical protein